MNNVLVWLLALLLTIWPSNLVSADGDEDPRTLCGVSDFFNSTDDAVPYSCTYLFSCMDKL